MAARERLRAALPASPIGPSYHPFFAVEPLSACDSAPQAPTLALVFPVGSIVCINFELPPEQVYYSTSVSKLAGPGLCSRVIKPDELFRVLRTGELAGKRWLLLEALDDGGIFHTDAIFLVRKHTLTREFGKSTFNIADHLVLAD